MTKTIRLTLDKAMLAKLEELADYHGESTEDTLRLLIRYDHAVMRRFAEEEFGQNSKAALQIESQIDEEIPF